jgi:iron complex transport system substrate-binding protein
LPVRPRVFFEEWDDPLISGIRWVEELVEIAGGVPNLPELANAGLAKNGSSTPRKSRDAIHRSCSRRGAGRR